MRRLRKHVVAVATLCGLACAKSGSSDLGAASADTSSLRIIEREPPAVPPAPPDSIPEEILADSNLIQNPTSSMRWPRNALMLLFEPSATQAERDAALALVNGTVVGGRPLSVDGFFLVKVPHDGTDGPLLQAIDTLQQLPQVRYAVRYFLSTLILNHFRPNDGVGWDGVWPPPWVVTARDEDAPNPLRCVPKLVKKCPISHFQTLRLCAKTSWRAST